MTKKLEFVNKLVNATSDDVFLEISSSNVKKNGTVENEGVHLSKGIVSEKSKTSETKMQKKDTSENRKDMKSSVDTKNSKGQRSRASSDTKSPKRSEVKVKEKDAKKQSQAIRRLRGSVHTIQALSMLNKLKNRKRDGTPDKSGTPSQDAMPDEAAASARNVIWNEEIEKLQIKDEELTKVREPRPPESDRKTPTTERLTVRKLKPAEELNRPRPKVVTVAKPAPLDADVKPMDLSGFSGPRYDPAGNVIAHSILGTYDDFHREAVTRGDLLDIPAVRKEDMQPTVPTLKYEKKKRRHDDDQWGHSNESNALRNWQLKMLERKKQQGYISKLLQKNPEDLAMNQADNYRTIQEDRYIVDRTIPAVGYGKGFRVGSEFWKQQEKFGDDLTGVHMTLTQTEKGYPPPIEHIGIPAKIREEKGWHWAPTHTRPMHYPWHKSGYLEQRKKQLKQFEEELDPHKPDYDGLEVIGTCNPYSGEGDQTGGTSQMLLDMERQPITEMEMLVEDDDDADITGGNPDTRTDSNPTPVFGPSIQFAGQAARWTGDSYSFKDQVGIEARVNFETFSGDRVTSYLTIINNGTTSVYYDWKKKPKENPFDLAQASVQRFYFNNSSGVILPGETMKFPFVFKSPNAGVFQEQWQFETRPVVCGGAALLVTLRGIAFAEDKYKGQRLKLESELQKKEADQMMRHILEEIIGGMRTPERPSSPIDAYITEEEIFQRCNPKLHYHHDAVQELKQLHLELVPPEEREGRTWDLCVDDLKDDILLMDDDDERKETFLHQLNTCVSKMSFTPQKPVHKQLYKAGYQLLVEAVDEMVGQSVVVRQVMGLPEKDLDEFSEDTKSKQESRESRRASRTPSKPTNNPKLQTEDSTLSDGKGRKSGAGDKGAAKAPDKKAPTPAKDKDKDKGGKMSKESTKADIKSGKQSATPAPRGPPSRGKTAGSLGDREKTGSPTSMLQSSFAHEDPIIDRKYKEKVFAQTYTIVADTIDKMEFVFDEIIRNDANRPTLQP
ncbi:MYCBP-associated protein-like isoform X4 [Mercenaria mercenaria]|uniref:MYCBP-associated protein-like isoform X4 n=1 Tax=Mercenaria mercenaria TaxID=6596 RepID=UPI00234E8DE4|nr:MYCBP-associated protein-like isoform X4 [Mercenaria mercenaria]